MQQQIIFKNACLKCLVNEVLYANIQNGKFTKMFKIENIEIL